MTLALLAAQVALAVVFVTAAITKLADRDGARRAMAEFGVPGRFVGTLAALLPLVELAAAAALVPDLTARWGAGASLVLLLAFSAAIALNLSRGRTPDCHCFGRLHSAPVSWWTVARNLLLALVAAGLVWGPAPAWLLLTAVAAALGVTVLERLRSSREPAPRGLPVGSEAPEFRLSALDGAVVTLAGLRERGRPVLLVFSDAHCGPCAALAPDVARWQREHADLTIAVIERGHERAGPATDEHGRTVVLLQEDDKVASAYSAIGTPSAVLVDVDGRIASGLAPGEAAIRLLVGELEYAEPAAWREHLLPLARREFLLRLAGSVAGASVVLAWPARALAGAARPGSSSVECGPKKKCPQKFDCVDGKCLCTDEFPNKCGRECVNKNADNRHCNGCNKPCDPGEVCAASKCRKNDDSECPEGCPATELCCKGKCVNLRDDAANCGVCGGISGKRCAGTQPTCCVSICKDVDRDLDHCGRCYNQCDRQESVCAHGHCCPKDKPVWQAGKCREKCPPGLAPCPKTAEKSGGTCYRKDTQKCCDGGIPVDIDSMQFDDKRCGGCKPCPEGQTCEKGKCVASCPPGTKRTLTGTCEPPGGCGGVCSDTPSGLFDVTCCDGECIATLINHFHCGGCGRECVSTTPELGSCGCSAGMCLTIGQFGMQPCVASRPLTRRERRRLRSARNRAG